MRGIFSIGLFILLVTVPFGLSSPRHTDQNPSIYYQYTLNDAGTDYDLGLSDNDSAEDKEYDNNNYSGSEEIEDSLPLLSYNPSTDGDPNAFLDKCSNDNPPCEGIDIDAARRDWGAFYKNWQDNYARPIPDPSQDDIANLDMLLNDSEIKRTNQLRKKHSADPVEFDPKVAVYASKYAKELANLMSQNGGILVHNPALNSFGLGECLAGDGPTSAVWSQTKNAFDWGEDTWKPPYNGSNTDRWYAEIKNYIANGNKPASEHSHGSNEIESPATGHFTQVVWKATTKMGCAEECYQTGNDPSVGPFKSCVVVCDYYPGGNVDGEYDKNVSV